MTTTYILTFLSSLLLALCFPRWNMGYLAWVALVPLLFAIERTRRAKEAILAGYACGVVFFLLTITWLRHVTLFGLFFAACFLSLYFALFGAFAKRTIDFFYARPTFLRSLLLLVALPSLWTALEFLRSEIPVMAMGWANLSYSQTENPAILQLARLGGGDGITFVVVLVNVLVFLILKELRKRTGVTASVMGWVGLEMAVLVLSIGYGKAALAKPALPPALRVGVIQGNIPQEEKWDEAFRRSILEKYVKLTTMMSFDRPDLVVWPEAAFPDFFMRSFESSGLKPFVQNLGIPLLVGTPTMTGDGKAYNSAVLVGSDGEVKGRYDKIHLVPFGEYVPFHFVLFFLERYAASLGVGDFKAGKEYTVFDLDVGERHAVSLRFSVLICFEDIFPSLVRRFVDQGANVLVVMTNDAWFGHTAAPYQHLQGSILRAVENGVWVVRSANTGVSCFINEKGQVVDRVKDNRGSDTFIAGGLAWPVPNTSVVTPYRRGGWVFPWVCLGASVLVLAGVRLTDRVK